MRSPRAICLCGLAAAKSLKTYSGPRVALMSLSMHPSAASSSFRQAGVAFKKRQAPDREGRRGEERGDDDAEAEHDSPARKRSVPGSGDDVA